MKTISKVSLFVFGGLLLCAGTSLKAEPAQSPQIGLPPPYPMPFPGQGPMMPPPFPPPGATIVILLPGGAPMLPPPPMMQGVPPFFDPLGKAEITKQDFLSAHERLFDCLTKGKADGKLTRNDAIAGFPQCMATLTPKS